MSSSTKSKPVFPLKDVEIKQVDVAKKISSPVFSNSWMSINSCEFSMDIEGVGTFYVSDGRYIEYGPHAQATPESLELYLNGSVFGAILHQRKILPVHGSSFNYHGYGVMLCGDSGAGKSSLTTAFCLDSAKFLTDDVTPLLFDDGRPRILPKSDRIKLWDDSLRQLSYQKEYLVKIRPEDEKFYLDMQTQDVEHFPLNEIFILHAEDVEKVKIEELNGTAAFSAVYDEIYRLQFLQAMPDAERAYFQQLIQITSHCKINYVLRPEHISIKDMKAVLEAHLKKRIA